MAQSKFTLYKYIKLKDGSWRYCKAAFYSNGKIKPNRCIVGGKEENIPKAPTTFTRRSSGFSWAPMDWKHSAGGMPCLTPRNSSACEEWFPSRARLWRPLPVGSR